MPGAWVSKRSENSKATGLASIVLATIFCPCVTHSEQARLARAIFESPRLRRAAAGSGGEARRGVRSVQSGCAASESSRAGGGKSLLNAAIRGSNSSKALEAERLETGKAGAAGAVGGLACALPAALTEPSIMSFGRGRRLHLPVRSGVQVRPAHGCNESAAQKRRGCSI